MPKFDFQLEPLLRHRRNLEKECQRRVAVAAKGVQEIEGDLREIEQAMRGATEDLRTNHLVGRLDLGFLAAHRRFTLGMQRKGMMAAQRLAGAQRQLDEARKALGEAARQRKVIEKLRERQFERWRANLAARELAATDEVGMQLAYRAMAGEADGGGSGGGNGDGAME